MKNTHQFIGNISYTLHFQGLLSCNICNRIMEHIGKKGKISTT